VCYKCFIGFRNVVNVNNRTNKALLTLILWPFWDKSVFCLQSGGSDAFRAHTWLSRHLSFLFPHTLSFFSQAYKICEKRKHSLSLTHSLSTHTLHTRARAHTHTRTRTHIKQQRPFREWTKERIQTHWTRTAPRLSRSTAERARLSLRR